MTNIVARLLGLGASLALAVVSCGGSTAGPSAIGRVLFEDVDRLSVRYAVFSSDGNAVLAHVDDVTAGHRVALVRSGRLSMITPRDIDVADFAPMPEADAILVSYKPSSDELTEGPDPPFSSFAIYDLSGRRLQTIKSPRKWIDAQAGMAVRPDGRMAVVGSLTRDQLQADLVEFALDGSMMRNLTNTAKSCEGPGQYLDSETLLFDSGICATAGGPEDGWIGTMNLRTRAVRKLTPDSQVAATPSAAPGSDLVVYEAYPTEGIREERGIWAIRPDGSERRLLLPVSGVYPSLHPKGDRVLYLEVGAPGEPGRLRLATLPTP